MSGEYCARSTALGSERVDCLQPAWEYCTGSNLTLLASSLRIQLHHLRTNGELQAEILSSRFLRHFVQLEPGQAEDPDTRRTFSCVQSAGQADRKAQAEAPKSGNDRPVVSFTLCSSSSSRKPSLGTCLFSLGAWQSAGESYVAGGPSQGIDIELVPGSRRRTQEIDEGLIRPDLHARRRVYTYVTSSFLHCSRAA